MKKNFLFKGVSVLGAMLLLATSVMPGLQYAYADALNTETTGFTWYYVHDEQSWSEAYGDETNQGPLYKYYIDHPDEDIEKSDTQQAAGFNDRVYVGTIGGSDVSYKATWQAKSQLITNTNDNTEQYYMKRLDETSEYYNTDNEWKAQYPKFHGLEWDLYTDAALITPAGKTFNITALQFPGFVHNWHAAALNEDTWPQYPWAVIDTEGGFFGKIELKYGEDAEYPWGEDARLFNSYAIASIPRTFKNKSFLIADNATHYGSTWVDGEGFDLDNFKITLIPAYKVTFDTNGGVPAEIDSQAIFEGNATEPDDPTKEGYVFLGWFEDGATSSYDFSTSVSADVSLTAKWGHNVILAGIDGATLPEGVTSPVLVEDGTAFDSTIKPTKDGSAFLGWYLDDTTKYVGGNITANTTLTAHWFDNVSNISSLMHDSDAFDAPANNGTSKKATYELSTDGKTLRVTGKIDYDAVHCSGEKCYNRYGIAVKFNNVDDLYTVFPNATVTLNGTEYDIWGVEGVVSGKYSVSDDEKSWPDGIYRYPKVLTSNQTDTIKIQWNDDFAEEYTINVVDAILELPEAEEINDNGDVDQDAGEQIVTELVIPSNEGVDESDASKIFTTTVGTGDDKMIYEGIPAGSAVTFSEPGTGTVASSDVATNSNFTAQVLKIFQMSFASHATFSKPLGIKMKTDGNAKIKVKHTGETSYGFNGLATTGATCTDGAADAAHQYNGDVLSADTNGFVTIYTCGASEFVAYTETQTSGTTSGGGGGGSSSYSCKNLPDNAVANNTTKPTKSTNYSYSTDTSKVCTFQCKSGYAWNEKDAKCEKSNTNAEDVAENNEDTNNNEENNDGNSNENVVADNGFSQEFIDAYNFAYKNGITTMPSIESADMYGPLTRIAMAKMLSQYAINVLGKTPDTTKVVPTFPDVSAQLDADYNNGVTLAYQLGIMGIGIEEFRPFAEVTRAEFGTALSRMLFGLADGEGAEWYKTHLDKLMNEKIITNDNPNLKELRGYVMIMLMRSAQ